MSSLLLHPGERLGSGLSGFSGFPHLPALALHASLGLASMGSDGLFLFRFLKCFLSGDQVLEGMQQSKRLVSVSLLHEEVITNKELSGKASIR